MLQAFFDEVVNVQSHIYIFDVVNVIAVSEMFLDTLMDLLLRVVAIIPELGAIS